MFTVKEYYSRKVLGIFPSKQAAYKYISESGLLTHHVKGKVVVAIR